MTDNFKVKTGIAPELMKGVFEFADVPYNLRNQYKCNRCVPCTERHIFYKVQNYWTKFLEK